MSHYDITGKIGLKFLSMTREPEWPMYSFEGPSWKVWNAIATVMHERGATDEEIREWLQSRSARYALDNSLGEILKAAATKWAEENFIPN